MPAITTDRPITTRHSPLGIVIDGMTAVGFMAGRKGDLNIRGAFLHMLGDAAASAGVALAGFAIALTAHLIKPEGTDNDALLAATCQELQGRFGIAHATLQIECGGGSHPCSLAPA